MTDVHSKEVRSYNMSRIKSKDTKPEMIVRRFLFSRGFRFRLHSSKLPGKPDIILPKYKIAIFVHGCFWHGHENCKYFKMPKTKTEWWQNKINSNIDNDFRKKVMIEKLNWRIITLWECDLKPAKQAKTLQNLLSLLSC